MHTVRNTWGEEGKFTAFSVPLHEYKVIKKGMVINLNELFLFLIGNIYHDSKFL